MLHFIHPALSRAAALDPYRLRHQALLVAAVLVGGTLALSTTVTATIAAELGETVQGDDHYRVLFVIGILLFVIAFVVNLTADLVVKGVRGKQNG